jgi:hypothetical protein
MNIRYNLICHVHNDEIESLILSSELQIRQFKDTSLNIYMYLIEWKPHFSLNFVPFGKLS